MKTDESVYHSCPEDSDWDSDDDETKADPLPGSLLGSITVPPFFADSETARILVCVNAARVLLTEVSRVASHTIKQLRWEIVLRDILSVCSKWIGLPEKDIMDILTLPIFQSSLEQSASERRSCSLQNICELLAQLGSMRSVAVLVGQNDALTVAPLPSLSKSSMSTCYVVFNPQCRASRDMGGASLRYFSNISETARHVYNVISIHRGTNSKDPGHFYTGYVLVPAELFGIGDEMAAVYQANVSVLQANTEIAAMKEKELALRAEIARLEAELEREVLEEKKILERKEERIAEIVALEEDLKDAHSFTAALLDGFPADEASQSTSTDTEKPLSNNHSIDKMAHSETSNMGNQSVKAAVDANRVFFFSQRRMSEGTDHSSPKDSQNSEASTPLTSPDTLFNSSAGQLNRGPGTSSANAAHGMLTGDKDKTPEAQPLIEEVDAERASLLLAKQLMQEDTGTLAAFQNTLATSPLRNNTQKQANLNDPRYLAPRKLAREAREAAWRCFSESVKAYDDGDKVGAKELSNEGKCYQKQVEELNSKAADWIYRVNNVHSPPNEIDLHGLYVREAIPRVEQAVQSAILRGDSKIHLVVGRGMHSPDGVAKLRPAIAELMATYTLAAHVDPHNVGVLIVQLNESRGSEKQLDMDEIQRRLEGEDEQCIIM